MGDSPKQKNIFVAKLTERSVSFAIFSCPSENHRNVLNDFLQRSLVL